MIPFSPPRIDQRVIDEVTDALKSGWITTGPKTKLFEKKLSEYCGNKSTAALNSWANAMELFLRWYGIGEGDEVILPAYTYCASINVIIHTGARPVLVDINEDDFNMSVEAVKKVITSRTKAIMPVDIGGFPCDYDGLFELVRSQEIRNKFTAKNENEKKLGRILIASDAAHSFGATYKGKVSGSLGDVTCFSFHAVKNLTTAEGGTVSLNLPGTFDNEAIYKELCIKSLHGQSKDALAKTQKGNWRYDVLEPGFKCNMTDLQAAIGLVELDRYSENLDRRKLIFAQYDAVFNKEDWAICPKYKDETRESSYHLYLLRIKGATEPQRDAIMHEIFEQDVSVNCHFQPLPILTAYKNLGYKMADYPQTWNSYSNEITLPVYYNLTDEQVNTIIQAVRVAVQKVMS